MSRGGPDVAEERAIKLRRRKIAAAEVPWRSNGLLVSLVFFVLTLAALAAAFWLLEVWHLPKGWITGVVAIATAEVLIRGHRFFGTGIESALWIGGLFAFILGLPGKGSPEALLLFAAASALAGCRMRNALFGAIASIFVISYFAARDARETAAGVALVVSLVALIVLTRELQRPSTEWLFSALLIIPPIAGAIATAERLPPIWATTYFIAACACVITALRTPGHALFIGAGVHLAIAIGTLAAHGLLPWRLEWRMIAGGAFLLAVSATLSRLLRKRTTGIVITPDRLTAFDEALQIGGALALQPRVQAAPAQRESGGGTFGGAGASGEF